MINIKKMLWQSLLPTLLCCIFTQSTHSEARPGLPNSIESNYASEISADGFYNWGPEKFPLKVHFDKSQCPAGFQPSNVDLLKTCFDDWAKVSSGKLSWIETNNPEKADINVTWSDKAVEANRGTEAGKTRNYARYNPETNWGIIDRSQMRLLTRLPEREFTQIELRKAYLHEVGHALGIAGHSADPNDIMYFSVSNHKRVDLSQKDIGTLHFLYQQPSRSLSNAATNSLYRSGEQSVSVVKHTP